MYNVTESRSATNITLAESHIGKGQMVSSAQLCLDDARALHARGEYVYAARRAAESIAYSVGVAHADYAYVAGIKRA